MHMPGFYQSYTRKGSFESIKAEFALSIVKAWTEPSFYVAKIIAVIRAILLLCPQVLSAFI